MPDPTDEPGSRSGEAGPARLSAHAHVSPGAVDLSLAPRTIDLRDHVVPRDRANPHDRDQAAARDHALPEERPAVPAESDTGPLPFFYDQEADDDDVLPDQPLTGEILAAGTAMGDAMGDGAGDVPGEGSHHRHARPARTWPRALGAGTLAVGALVGLVLLGVWGFGGSTSKSGGKPTALTAGTGLTLPSPLEQAASHAPSVAPTHAAVAPPAAATPSKAPAVAAGTASVTVLNQTSIQDLGATEAGRISAAGWHVRRVRGVNARDTVTTVYYDASQADQASLLLKTVPSVKRMLPRPRWLLGTGGLIVVVASDAA